MNMRERIHEMFIRETHSNKTRESQFTPSEDAELRSILSTLGAKCYQNPMKLSDHVDEALKQVKALQEQQND